MKKPELKVTKLVGNAPVEGTCTACPTVGFETGSIVGDPKEHQAELERLFADHFKRVHLHEDASQAAARIVREATEER
jgi:hypothetical protein